MVGLNQGTLATLGYITFISCCASLPKMSNTTAVDVNDENSTKFSTILHHLAGYSVSYVVC